MFVCRRHQIKFQVYVRVHVNISFVSIILINLIELIFFLDNGLCNILQTFGPAYELFPKCKFYHFHPTFGIVHFIIENLLKNIVNSCAMFVAYKKYSVVLIDRFDSIRLLGNCSFRTVQYTCRWNRASILPISLGNLNYLSAC